MSRLYLRIARDLRTASHIPTPQLFHRLRFLGRRRLYAAFPQWPLRTAARCAAGARARDVLPRVPAVLSSRGSSDEIAARAAAAAAGSFTHIGMTRSYTSGVDWHDAAVSPLWSYQMQYLGAVVDMALVGAADDARCHLASWRAAFEKGWDPVAWHPYPASLRLVNLCLAAGELGGFDALGTGVARLVALHARYVEAHLERDVRGNHLLENLVALLVAARYVDGSADSGGRAALALLREELAEQIPADGMHFECAPMYHAVVMQRLGILTHVVEDARTLRIVQDTLRRMAWRLAWLRCPDGGIPLLGDSARDFAPAVDALLAACSVATSTAGATPSCASSASSAPRGVSSALDAGLHALRDGVLWCLFDAGAVCPEYLPAHGQADTLSVEVWVGDACVVTDPGLHEYTGDERAWGRSSRAHSTITIDDRDSSEVYGSFRVGGRETMERVVVDDTSVTATLRPWSGHARSTRRVSLPGGGVLRFDDTATAPPGSIVRARLHLHPDVAVVGGEATDVLRLRVAGRDVTVRASGPLTLERGRCSRRFGEIRETRIVVLVLERDTTGVARGWSEIVPEIVAGAAA